MGCKIFLVTLKYFNVIPDRLHALAEVARPAHVLHVLADQQGGDGAAADPGAAAALGEQRVVAHDGVVVLRPGALRVKSGYLLSTII